MIRLLVDMTSEQIVSCIDFRYIEDALTPQEAIEILSKDRENKEKVVLIITISRYYLLQLIIIIINRE